MLTVDESGGAASGSILSGAPAPTVGNSSGLWRGATVVHRSPVRRANRRDSLEGLRSLPERAPLGASARSRARSARGTARPPVAGRRSASPPSRGRRPPTRGGRMSRNQSRRRASGATPRPPRRRRRPRRLGRCRPRARTRRRPVVDLDAVSAPRCGRPARRAPPTSRSLGRCGGPPRAGRVRPDGDRRSGAAGIWSRATRRQGGLRCASSPPNCRSPTVAGGWLHSQQQSPWLWRPRAAEGR